MANFYPVIGKTDNYEFLSPFDGLNKDTTMTVISSMMMREYETAEVDVLKLVYEQNGLTKQDLLHDISLDAMLVTIKTNNDIIYIPSTYLHVQDQNKRTQIYNRKVLVMDLGFLPTNENITDLQNELVSVTVSTLGLSPDIRSVVISDDEYVTDDEHDLRLANRAVSRVSNYTSIGRVSELERTITNKDRIITQLKQIINTLNTP